MAVALCLGGFPALMPLAGYGLGQGLGAALAA
jgi:hypothetical protein